MLKHRDLPLLAALLLAGYFLYFSAPGLTTLFAPDDLQNLYGYWSRGFVKTAGANLLVATADYRPMGGIFYLPIFQIFGFNPLPYRIALFALLWLNFWLFYCLARRVTGSREAAGLAVLAGCFHANAVAAYYSTSVLYEVLCFGFLAGSLVYYARVRQQGGTLTWKQNVMLLLLFAGALNSKEMAVILPPVLLLYELLYGGRNFTVARLVPVAATGVLTAAYTYAKMTGTNNLTRYEAYRPVYSAARYLETMRAYAGALFLSDQPFSPAAAILFWLVLFAAAALLRNRAMIFGAAFAFLAFLPVNFVPTREGFVLYIPLIGFGIYAGALIGDVAGRIARLLHLSPEQRMEAGVIAYLALAVFLISVHHGPARELDGAVRNAQRVTWEVITEFKNKKPQFKPGERILLSNTPFTDWDLYFLAKLYARDPSVQIAITAPGSTEIRGDVYQNFDQEFRFDGSMLIKTK